MLLAPLFLAFATLAAALTPSVGPHAVPLADASDSHAQAAAAAKVEQERLERQNRAAKRAIDGICAGCSGLQTAPAPTGREHRRKPPARPTRTR